MLPEKTQVPAFGAPAWSQLSARPPRRPANPPAAGIYVHWPFCLSKCTHCDFVTSADVPSKVEQYSQSLLREIGSFRYSQSPDLAVFDTLYFGGGTPSLMPLDVLAEVMVACDKKFRFAPNREVTLEVNPGTVSLEKGRAWRKLGVDRISLGMEAFSDEELAALKRRHDVSEALESYWNCRNAGFENISVDLICGLPHQTAAHWQGSLKRVVDLSPEHVSVYLLELHKGTKLHSQIQRGRTELPSEEDTISRYYECIDQLGNAGYEQYEIANFARQGYDSRHNLKYWSDQPYVAFGVAGHSCFGGVRYINESRLEEYCRKVSQTGSGLHEKIEQNFRLWLGDYAMTALRLRKGIDLKAFHETYGLRFEDYYEQEISRMLEWEFLQLDAGCLRLTRKALAISNSVFLEFI